MLGLNGILADESGLGKKAQVIAFLTYLAETAGLWGPFLIVAPTSSLFKWQQDFDRLSPRFNVISYWGKPMERKVLRQFWEKTSFHTEDASFHVVITSHQVMASDLKYFGKIKWQYLIMDDAQGSITSSTKWMPLLSFHCRNKLLLSNNPRLNSQSHLFSYLYFTMPSLYDAQEELSETFLKELESPTLTLDNDSGANQHVLRLRAVVQKFLLRRVKEELEAEMTDDVNILVYCSLSRRQLLNGGEGSDSASPSNSEEPDTGELETDMDVKECHDDDNYNFSMDEGYIGMSPDSFEDYEEDSSPRKAKMMRGTGRRGRPPSRMRFQMRDFGDSQARRGPGRPRLKPVGPANQAVRGRPPGRPPLSKKAETISSGLTPFSSSQRVFGFYSSPDLELS
ncbi:putative DNA helicase Ino80 [Orchesella cincta]|uniref:Chromatin-remodeling ATPase INO80 n=1 Tax=Orchesella cincta TaxID=48709 RepID=A0A1D2NLG5_ORCCI|nr:putative DNA helicase Ino80 [Orchesella cincta]